jgi:hypothetical protein
MCLIRQLPPQQRAGYPGQAGQNHDDVAQRTQPRVLISGQAGVQSRYGPRRVLPPPADGNHLAKARNSIAAPIESKYPCPALATKATGVTRAMVKKA